jgi:hypothetical protein
MNDKNYAERSYKEANAIGFFLSIIYILGWGGSVSKIAEYLTSGYGNAITAFDFSVSILQAMALSLFWPALIVYNSIIPESLFIP